MKNLLIIGAVIAAGAFFYFNKSKLATVQNGDNSDVSENPEKSSSETVNSIASKVSQILQRPIALVKPPTDTISSSEVVNDLTEKTTTTLNKPFYVIDDLKTIR